MTVPGATRRAGPFSPAAALWLVVVGGLSGVLFLVLNAYAPDLRRSSDGGAHALSTSAVGFAGLVELLRSEGVPVAISRTRSPEREGRASLLVLTPGLLSEPKQILGLHASGLELIVLPKWIANPDEKHPGWVSDAALAPRELVETRLLHALDRTDHILRRSDRRAPILKAKGGVLGDGTEIPAGRITDLQTIAGPDRGWVSVVEDQDGETVLAKRADREVYLLTDPDLLDNQGLAQLANAQGASVLIDALRGGHEPVAIDVTLAGFTRTRSLLRLAFEPPFLAATLCALAAAALMAVHAATRFGPHVRARPAFAFGKRALADSSAALVRLVRREHRMGGRYAALTRNLAAAAVGAPKDLDETQLDALLDRLGRARGAGSAFSELVGEARRASDIASLTAAVGKLYRWRLEMTRERR